jgi:transcriptional regulator with XRE-family HTH domain
MSQFRPAKKRISVSVGESVRIVRELQGLSQNQLAELTGIPQAAWVSSGRRFWRRRLSAIPQS